MSYGSDWGKAYTEWASQDKRERQQQLAKRDKSIGDQLDEHRVKVQEEQRLIEQRFERLQFEKEEKKKQDEELRMSKEAERIAIEEQQRRFEIETNIENARTGLIAACVIASVLVLLLITNAQSLGIVVTIILFLVFVLYMFRNTTNPFIPGLLLIGLPVCFLVALPIFINMWWLSWVILVLVVGITSYYKLQRYKKIL